MIWRVPPGFRCANTLARTTKTDWDILVSVKKFSAHDRNWFWPPGPAAEQSRPKVNPRHPPTPAHVPWEQLAQQQPLRSDWGCWVPEPHVEPEQGRRVALFRATPPKPTSAHWGLVWAQQELSLTGDTAVGDGVGWGREWWMGVWGDGRSLPGQEKVV